MFDSKAGIGEPFERLMLTLAGQVKERLDAVLGQRPLELRLVRQVADDQLDRSRRPGWRSSVPDW